MNLQAQAKALWDAKRQELEAMYPSLKTMPRPAFPVRPAAAGANLLPEPYRLVLGRDEHGPFTFDSKLLCAHIDLVGGIGSGKSNAMRQLAWLQISSAPAQGAQPLSLIPMVTIVTPFTGQHCAGLSKRRFISANQFLS